MTETDDGTTFRRIHFVSDVEDLGGSLPLPAVWRHDGHHGRDGRPPTGCTERVPASATRELAPGDSA